MYSIELCWRVGLPICGLWSKFTGVLIWKTQNPWTGLRGQFYDHLLDQTAGFYGCRSAAEPIHVQLNLSTCFIEVINTTSKQLSDVAIDVSVWDLEGTCPSHVVHEKFSVPPKKTLPIAEMKYPKSENPKPVYFLLLKLYRQSDYGILSRNFYWLHLPGGDYKLLEAYRAKKIPLEITSRVSVNGTSHQVHIYVENTSTNPNHTDELPNKNFCPSIGDGDYDDASVLCVLDRTKNKQQPARFLQRIYRHFSRESDSLRIVRTAGANIGVAFFLHFSVHALEMERREGEDTRILPVHYSDNYFSLVPGESTSINLTFDVPPGVTPHVILNGWNFQEGFTVL